MRSWFTTPEIEDYRTNGFLAVDDLLSRTELERWREIVAAAMAEVQTGPLGVNSAKVFTQRMNLRRTSAAVKELVEDPGVGRLIADLEGVDAVRIYLDQALVKEPYGSPTQYHLDLPRWPFDSSHVCTVWVALDDATLENGCLYFVPGSHHLGLTAAGDLGPDLGAVFAAHPEAARLPVPVPAPRRRGHVPQRPDGAWRRGQHDPGPAPGDDGGVRARRRPLRRHQGHPGPGRGLPRHPLAGGSPPERRAEPGRLLPLTLGRRHAWNRSITFVCRVERMACNRWKLKPSM
jgi:phytanoyl-CoA hydroxylase